MSLRFAGQMFQSAHAQKNKTKMEDDDEDVLEDVSPGNTPFPLAVADNSNLFEVSFRKEIENVTTGSANIKVDGENTDSNIACDEDSLHTFDLELETSAEDKVPDNRAEVNSFEKQEEEKCSLLSDQDTLTSFKNEQGKNILTKDAAGPVLVNNIKFSADETNERELNCTKKINLVIEDKNEFSSDGTDIRHRHIPISELEFNCESNANCPNVTPAKFVTSDLQTEKPLETSIASVDSGRVDRKKNDCGSTKATMEHVHRLEPCFAVSWYGTIIEYSATVFKDMFCMHFAGFSFFKFFMAEVTRGYHLEMEEDRYTEKRQKVYTFMRIPMEFEKLMVFGFMLCLDCFLYVFTYLPLRVIVALYKLTTGMLLWRRHLLEPVQKCDLLKAWILASCFVLLDYVDFGVIYHIVRGQSVIKLYVIYNMLDIADRLFSSFGQDILDALFWTATEPKDRRRDNLGILPHFVLAVIYVFLHSILVLFQATCLNVAVNSHSKALLVVMVSNQFVELKGSVFKRFEKNNLFQMSCSDIRERFHYLVLVSIVTLRNQTEFNWNRDNLYTILPYLVAVLSSEYLVDWLKHAFITKFNDIPVEVYSEYKLLLAQDATSSRQKNAHTDHFDLVSRRMGFIPLPLGVLVTKIVTQSFALSGPTGVCLVVSTYIFLCSLKILNSIVFLGKACQYVNEKREKDAINANSAVKGMSKRSLNQQQQFGVQSSASFLDSNVSLSQSAADKEKMSDSNSTSEKADKKKRTKKLEEIDRYTLCSNQIVL